MMFRRVSSSESPLTKIKTLSSSSLGSPASPLPSLAVTSSSSPPAEKLPQEAIRPMNRQHRRQSSMSIRNTLVTMRSYMNSTRLVVLLVLCLQNSMFTTLRRYSQGVLKETYSKHELLLLAEIIKIVYSAWMIQNTMLAEEKLQDMGSSSSSFQSLPKHKTLSQRLSYLVSTSKKMLVLALIYGAMNILSFVSLRNISAGMFTIFAQTKILTTAIFSTIILNRKYSWTKWRALIALMMGVLLFSEPIWGKQHDDQESGNKVVGTIAVMIEVSLSGFASIYFEKVIKTDPLQLGIWERNFQLALGSIPVYLIFIVGNGGGTAGFLQGWSLMALMLSFLGAAGGLLVALSIKHGDSILKTLATTGAIVLTGLLDYWFLNGPMTPSMIIAGVQVIVSICNYTFDATPAVIMGSNEAPANGGGADSSSVAGADDTMSVGSKETELLLRKV